MSTASPPAGDDPVLRMEAASNEDPDASLLARVGQVEVRLSASTRPRPHALFAAAPQGGPILGLVDT